MSGLVACSTSLDSLATRLPAIIERADARTFERYLSFFASHIRNRNTRDAYAAAAKRCFRWCEDHGIHDLHAVTRLHIAAYIEDMTNSHSAPTVKQHLAGLRMLFAYLGVPRDNPAEGVRGPKHIVRTGRTPVLAAEEARRLLESIPIETDAGRRDRALIGLMVYTFARVSAVIGVRIGDYYLQGRRRWVRLSEKGGRQHAVPVHHKAEEYVDAYLERLTARGVPSPGQPLLRTIDRHGAITDRPMSRFTAWEVVKRRAAAAGIPLETTNHTFRATGITVYLENGGTIENARLIAAHASIKTTQTYDRRREAVTLNEINRILI